jgi:DNA-binding NtrC family response regulator
MAERSFTLLVVDDDRRLRDLLEKYLMEQGFWVVTAQSAEEARTWLGTENIAHRSFSSEIQSSGAYADRPGRGRASN